MSVYIYMLCMLVHMRLLDLKQSIIQSISAYASSSVADPGDTDSEAPSAHLLLKSPIGPLI